VKDKDSWIRRHFGKPADAVCWKLVRAFQTTACQISRIFETQNIKLELSYLDPKSQSDYLSDKMLAWIARVERGLEFVARTGMFLLPPDADIAHARYYEEALYQLYALLPFTRHVSICPSVTVVYCIEETSDKFFLGLVALSFQFLWVRVTNVQRGPTQGALSTWG